MRIRELVQDWGQVPAMPAATRELQIRVPLHTAAQIAALADMFADGNESAMAAQLLAAALTEVETSFPYVKGDKVAEDEFGDPVHADAGHTPRFLELTQQHFARLQGKAANGA
ncbi:MAG: pilin assembly protein [Pseudomonadota bacterium]